MFLLQVIYKEHPAAVIFYLLSNAILKHNCSTMNILISRQHTIDGLESISLRTIAYVTLFPSESVSPF